jgi:uncharacterized protein
VPVYRCFEGTLVALPFLSFTYRRAWYRIHSSDVCTVTGEIIRQRHLLEEYIRRYPAFGKSLVPIPEGPDPPDIAVEMHIAAEKTGVGPMAAVAGAIAERAARAVASGDTIIDNGGDIYITGQSDGAELTVGIWAGGGHERELHGGLAFRVSGDETPLSICSSSGSMGHSLSLGRCDLATVISTDGALADAAATLAANLVVRPEDIKPALEEVFAVEGIRGALIVCRGSVGFIGDIPTVIPYSGSMNKSKVN